MIQLNILIERKPFAENKKLKTGLARETSTNHNGDRIEGAIRLSDSSPCLQRSTSDESGMFFEPARDLTAQVSIDDRRRCELANILRDNDSREALIGQWMSLIEEKSETELLNIDKLLILLTGILDFLDQGCVEALEDSLDNICDRANMDSDIRIDLERSFYLFIKAANNVLSSRNILPPHVLFALDNIIRRVAENLVGLIRSDFIPAVNNLAPLTSSTDLLTGISCSRTPSSSSFDGLVNDETTRLHQQYKKLAEKNREQIQQLINIESNNSIDLINLINNQKNSTTSRHSIFRQAFYFIGSMISKTKDFFFPTELPGTGGNTSCPNSPASTSAQRTNGVHNPWAPRGVKRSRAILELEQEHERLLKDITDNRTRINELLHG
ncbi:unnamed protein product [Rotaria magnacalcarata]